MPLTKEQWLKDIKPYLIKLGYTKGFEMDNWNSPMAINTLRGKFYTWLSHLNELSESQVINEYNPELFLALASMTQGEDWIIGEWLVHGGRFFKCTQLSGANSILGLAGNENKDIYRKATAEELINHFKGTVKKEFILPEKWALSGCKELQDYFSSIHCTWTGENKIMFYHHQSKYNEYLKNNLVILYNHLEPIFQVFIVLGLVMIKHYFIFRNLVDGQQDLNLVPKTELK